VNENGRVSTGGIKIHSRVHYENDSVVFVVVVVYFIMYGLGYITIFPIKQHQKQLQYLQQKQQG
jgi:hypothetical protein